MLEVDERVVARIVDPLDVELLVLGNLSRDQLDRYGEVHLVADVWRRVAETHPGLGIVANASDPHVVWAASPAAVTWVALGLAWRLDAASCPSCGALLGWDDDRFECPSCGFAQPDTPNRLDGDTLVLGVESAPLTLAVPGRWNVANAALAVTAAVEHFDVALPDAARAVGAVTTVAGRYMAVPLGDGRTARVLLAKNPAGWSEVLGFVAGIDTAVVLAVNARGRGREGPVVAVGRPLRGAARARHRGERGALPRRGGAAPLRGGRAPRGAGPARGGAGAAGQHGAPGVLVHTVLGPVPALRGSGIVSGDSTLRVGFVYPELLGTYGDRGNAVVLVQRARWRGIPAELVEVRAGAPAGPRVARRVPARRR